MLNVSDNHHRCVELNFASLRNRFLAVTDGIKTYYSQHSPKYGPLPINTTRKDAHVTDYNSCIIYPITPKP